MKFTELKKGVKYTRDSFRHRFNESHFKGLPPVLMIMEEDRQSTDWRELTSDENGRLSISWYAHYKMTDHWPCDVVFFIVPEVSLDQLFYYWEGEQSLIHLQATKPK